MQYGNAEVPLFCKARLDNLHWNNWMRVCWVTLQSAHVGKSFKCKKWNTVGRLFPRREVCGATKCIQWYLKKENWPWLGDWSHRQYVRNGLCTEEATDFLSDQGSHHLFLQIHWFLANSALLGRKKEKTSANSRAVEILLVLQSGKSRKKPQMWVFLLPVELHRDTPAVP